MKLNRTNPYGPQKQNMWQGASSLQKKSDVAQQLSGMAGNMTVSAAQQKKQIQSTLKQQLRQSDQTDAMMASYMEQAQQAREAAKAQMEALQQKERDMKVAAKIARGDPISPQEEIELEKTNPVLLRQAKIASEARVRLEAELRGAKTKEQKDRAIIAARMQFKMLLHISSGEEPSPEQVIDFMYLFTEALNRAVEKDNKAVVRKSESPFPLEQEKKTDDEAFYQRLVEQYGSWEEFAASLPQDSGAGSEVIELPQAGFTFDADALAALFSMAQDLAQLPEINIKA